MIERGWRTFWGTIIAIDLGGASPYGLVGREFIYLTVQRYGSPLMMLSMFMVPAYRVTSAFIRTR